MTREQLSAAQRPSLLIVCFTDISADARVKKQALLFADTHRVTTVGFGAAFDDRVEHIQLDATESQFARYREAVLLRLHLYRAAYAAHPWVRRVRTALRGRSFDSAIANDLDTLGVVLRVAGRNRTHADLHEFFPGLHDQVPSWNAIRRPYLEWQLHEYATRAASATTVSDTIADRYRDEFGVVCGVVRNAAPLQDLSPTEVARPLRIVHSGGAQPNRRIEVMMEAVAASRADATLDLYLTQQTSPYAQGLRNLAERLGDRVTVYPPVPQADLVATLNAYDVGIHVLPPTNTNNALALPNKFFDYLQARLGMIIGPTADMARLLAQYDVGVVADSFDVDAVTRAIDSLDPVQVDRWKHNAHARAAEGSAERQEHVWRDAIVALAGPA